MELKKAVGKGLPLLLIILVFTYLAGVIDWKSTLGVLEKGDPWLILLAAALTLIRFFIWSIKWRKNISPLSPIGVSKVFSILMTGVFLNQITPGRDTGGEPARAYYLSQMTGLKKREAFATIIIDKSANYIAVSTYIGFSILFITFFLRIPPTLKALLEGLLVGLVIITISALYVRRNLALPGIPVKILSRIYFFGPLKVLRKKFSTYASFEDYVMERVNEFIGTLRDLLKERKNVRDNLLLSYLIWGMVFLKTYIIFLAFGVKVNFFMVLSVEAISILLGLISFLPGGAGATEVTMIALFRSAGISVETATAVTIVTRAMYYLFSLGLGYLAFLYLKVFYKQDSREDVSRNH